MHSVTTERDIGTIGTTNRSVTAALVALSACAFSTVSSFLSALSYDNDWLTYAGLMFYRFALPWLVCLCWLVLHREDPWSGFTKTNVLILTQMRVIAALLEAAALLQLQLV